jgi:hypothetical protein
VRVLAAVVVALTAATPSRADFVTTFTGSGTNSDSGQAISASVTFQATGSTLTVTLTNTSLADVLVPTDVLTSVAFSITGDPGLSSVSAVLSPGSSVLFGTTDPGNVVGGEWAYLNNINFHGANSGISSTGLGIFGSPTFPGNDLQPPVSVDGLQYGITSAGDNPLTGNTDVTGKYALIQNSVTFTLGNLPGGLSASDISGVVFQYGTNLSDTTLTGGRTPNGNLLTPVPPSAVLLGLGAFGLVSRSLLRRRYWPAVA